LSSCWSSPQNWLAIVSPKLPTFKLLTQALDGGVFFNAPAVLVPAAFRQYEADKSLRGFEGLSECIVKTIDLRLLCEIVSGFTA
jgi:hypothetical protein